MHAHDHPRDTTSAAARTRPAPVVRTSQSTVDEILTMQRTAGNAAAAQFVALARQAEQEGRHDVARSTVQDVLSQRGTRLDPAVKADAEARFGRALPEVRLHTDAAAARSAQEVGAAAYTSGTHVVAGPGGMSREDMYHELWHVAQQQDGAVPGTDRGDGLRVSDPSDSKEKEAAAVARKAVRGEAPPAAGHTAEHHDHDGHDVQRTPDAWATNTDVLDAMDENANSGSRSKWPPIDTGIRAYLALENGDLDARERVLGELVAAIAAWAQNQQSFLTAALNQTINQSTSQKKRSIVDRLRILISDEYNEIRQSRQSAQAPPAPVPGPSTPMAMPGRSAAIPMAMPGGPRTRRLAYDHFDQESPGAEEAPARQTDLRALANELNDAPALPPGVELHLHLAQSHNVAAIGEEGLKPGAGAGIGEPQDGGPYYANNIYTLSGSLPDTSRKVAQDAGDYGPVGVLSGGTGFSRDPNYKKGAHMYTGEALPVRDQGEAPVSFTLPATPRTRTGITEFLNRYQDANDQLSEDEALLRVRGHLWNKFRLYVADVLHDDQ